MDTPKNVLAAFNAFLLGEQVYNGGDGVVFGPYHPNSGSVEIIGIAGVEDEVTEDIRQSIMDNMFCDYGLIGMLSDHARVALKDASFHEFKYTYDPVDIGDGPLYFVGIVKRDGATLYYLIRQTFSCPSNYIVEMIINV